MKLRIARKLDRHRRAKHSEKDKRTWWLTHRTETLQRAVKRLRRAWRTNHKLRNSFRQVGPDFFAANRIESMLVRQPILRQSLREGRGWKVVGYKRVVMVLEKTPGGTYQPVQHK